MALQKTHGVCIRRLDYSETSQIVTFYTRDFGRVDLIAKGAKRKRSATEGRIDLFASGEVVFVARRGALNVLAAFAPAERFEGLRASLPQAYAAFYVAELIDRGLHESQAHSQHSEGDPGFYAVCLDTLRQLAQGSGLEVTRMIFEAHLLETLGVGPQVQRCVECDGPLPGRGQVAFGVGRGGALCGPCAPADAWRVPVAALGVIGGLRRAAPASAGRTHVPPGVLPAVREILRRCVVRALEREPKMMRLL